MTGQSAARVDRPEARTVEQTDGTAVQDAGSPGQTATAPAFVYRPIWDIWRSAILSYWCVPDLRTSGANDGQGTGGAGGTAPAADIAALDLSALKTALGALAYLQRENRRLIVGCQVHFETMVNPATRRSFVELCRRTPDDMRACLVFEVVGTPADVSQNRTAAIVSALRPFCRAVHWTIPPEQKHCGGFADLGLTALGVDLDGWTGAERELIQKLNGLAAAIKRYGLKPFVHGIRSVSLATNAVCAGFDYISGDAVHRTLPNLENAYLFEAKDLFSHLGEGG